MPIYEYECRACGNQFEYLVLKNTPPAECPECHSPDLGQLISGFSVSSEDMTRANVQRARRERLASKDYRDQKVAEAEEIREHSPAAPLPGKPKGARGSW